MADFPLGRGYQGVMSAISLDGPWPRSVHTLVSLFLISVRVTGAGTALTADEARDLWSSIRVTCRLRRKWAQRADMTCPGPQGRGESRKPEHSLPLLLKG